MSSIEVGRAALVRAVFGRNKRVGDVLPSDMDSFPMSILLPRSWEELCRGGVGVLAGVVRVGDIRVGVVRWVGVDGAGAGAEIGAPGGVCGRGRRDWRAILYMS